MVPYSSCNSLRVAMWNAIHSSWTPHPSQRLCRIGGTTKCQLCVLRMVLNELSNKKNVAGTLDLPAGSVQFWFRNTCSIGIQSQYTTDEQYCWSALVSMIHSYIPTYRLTSVCDRLNWLWMLSLLPTVLLTELHLEASYSLDLMTSLSCECLCTTAFPRFTHEPPASTLESTQPRTDS